MRWNYYKLRQLSLLQSAMDSYYKLRQLFYYKVRHGLLQIATVHMYMWVKFTFPYYVEAMHERSLVSVKVEPRSTSRLNSALFIVPLFYDVIKIYVRYPA